MDFYPAIAAQRNILVNATYILSGSSAGKAALIDNKNNWFFGASDASISATEMASSANQLRLLPLLTGAIVIVYYIPGIETATSTPLILARDTLVGIYNGTVTYWDDALILRDNQQNTNVLPYLVHQPIRIMVRADGSGSTEILTRGLCAFDPNWSNKYGWYSAGNQWPVYNSSLQGTEGLMVKVLRTPYSMGYVDLNNAVTYLSPYATIVNKYGKAVIPSPTTVQSAAADFTSASVNIDNFYLPIVDGGSANSYPLAAFTYLVIRLGNPSGCDDAYELVRFILWAIYDSNAARLAKNNFFSTLTPEFQDLSKSVVAKMYCNGLNLVEQADIDLYNENADLTGVIFTAGVFTTFGIFALIAIGAWSKKGRANLIVQFCLDIGLEIVAVIIDISAVFSVNTTTYIGKMFVSFVGLGGTMTVLYALARIILLAFQVRHAKDESTILRFYIASIRRLPPTPALINTTAKSTAAVAVAYLRLETIASTSNLLTLCLRRIPLAALATIIILSTIKVQAMLVAVIVLESTIVGFSRKNLMDAVWLTKAYWWGKEHQQDVIKAESTQDGNGVPPMTSITAPGLGPLPSAKTGIPEEEDGDDGGRKHKHHRRGVRKNHRKRDSSSGGGEYAVHPEEAEEEEERDTTGGSRHGNDRSSRGSHGGYSLPPVVAPTSKLGQKAAGGIQGDIEFSAKVTMEEE
ncbi:Phosphate-binding protein PstS 1 [Blyttiomyces sp. JEL0837]|nr:Phosphate-binding protein PstS 1 [Blyttiomyces sp. JEL0837]